MANTLKLKRSAVQDKVPSTSDLELGELGLNTYDGKLFAKKSVDGTDSVVEIGATQPAIQTSHQVINADFTIPAGQNGASFVAVEVAAGTTVTVSEGSTWLVSN